MTTVAHDQAIYRQIADLIGADVTLEFLATLRSRMHGIGTLPFGRRPVEAVLAEVHQVTSEAGMMGFSDLSQACSAYENACLDGTVTQEIATRVDDAIRRASLDIDALLDAGEAR
ncbi:Hpt domain-containing protein [Methylobacterium brachiatum]